MNPTIQNPKIGFLNFGFIFQALGPFRRKYISTVRVRVRVRAVATQNRPRDTVRATAHGGQGQGRRAQAGGGDQSNALETQIQDFAARNGQLLADNRRLALETYTVA